MVSHVQDHSRTARVLGRIANASMVVFAVLVVAVVWQHVATGRIDVFLAGNAVLFGSWAVVASRQAAKRRRNEVCRSCEAIRPSWQAFCPHCGRLSV